jgi:formylglycine-generating enzyme required for sulfatase activity
VTANSQWTPQSKTFDGVVMALVPPGCFLMGTGDADIAALNKQYNTTWFSHESPQTKICFDRPFWIDKTDVTNGQFRRFNGIAGSDSAWTGDNRPQEHITWFEARDFCTLRGARLPTEAEWEYAARGPDDLVYPWGNNWNADNAVYERNSGMQTADVGSKPGGASWVGALDMAGNVWQWTSSIYWPYPYKDDWRESNTDTIFERVLRGGSWFNHLILLRSAGRDQRRPSYMDSLDSGFRCARSFD